MITSFILNVFFAGINALLSLMPNLSFPTPDAQNNIFLGLVWSMNRIIPVNAILECGLAVIAVRIGLQAWDFVVWVYHQFWGSS